MTNSNFMINNILNKLNKNMIKNYKIQRNNTKNSITKSYKI